MKRIILHWTAGSYTPSSHDKEHYHFLIDGKGKVHKGLHPVKANIPPLKSGKYAAHTKNCNSNSIGISICAMHDATERNYGKYPIKEAQWWTAVLEIAGLCKKYGIPVTPKTVLSHAEVQKNLGIKQNGKWDISVLPFDSSVKGARAVGDKLRKEVKSVNL